jgi:hypothetical protein
VVVLLVVMKWPGAITGDPTGLFLDFFSKEKNLGQPFSKVEMDVQVRMFKKYRCLKMVKLSNVAK